MRLFQRYNFSVPKRQKTGELVEKIYSLIDEHCLADAKVLFCFSDMLQSKVSAQKRVVKNFPEMEQFCVEAPEENTPPNPFANLWGTAQITNIPEQSSESLDPDQIVAAPPEVLIEIAQGIGRRFPFQTAQFLFWGVPTGTPTPPADSANEGWLTALPELGARGLSPQSYISVLDSWWVNGRNKGMTAALELPLPGDTATDIEVPKDLELILTSLGKCRDRQLVFFPTAQEIETQNELHREISPLIEKYKKEMKETNSYLERLKLPYPDCPSSQGVSVEPESIPKKRIITKHLKGLGYKHYGPGGGQGLMCFRKKSAANNILAIEFDFGSWSKSLHATLHFRGPLTQFSVVLPSSKDARALSGILSSEMFSRIIENISVVARAVEEDLVMEVERLLPTTPHWYVSLVR